MVEKGGHCQIGEQGKDREIRITLNMMTHKESIQCTDGQREAGCQLHLGSVLRGVTGCVGRHLPICIDLRRANSKSPNIYVDVICHF